MSDLSQLQHDKSALERERAGIVEKIHELRTRARQKSIEASATRQPLPETEIAHWQNGIKRHQAELMEVQAKIAAVNRELRKTKADQPVKTLSQLPRDVAVKAESAGDKPNGAIIQAPGDIKEGYALFLQFFRQLVVENIDPRLVEVFEKDAHGLVNDYRRMHKEP
jgi:predicted RNase H-like nuclease (RuvC/YqgF family)